MTFSWLRGARSTEGRLALVLAPWVAYAAAFLVLYRAIGPKAGLLVALPVAFVAGFAGMRCGLLAGLLASPLNVLLAGLTGNSAGVFAGTGGEIGMAQLALLGVAIGWLHDLAVKPQLELVEQLRLDEEVSRRVARLTTERLNLRLPIDNLPESWAHYVALLTDECMRLAGAIDSAVRLSHVADDRRPAAACDLNALVDGVLVEYQPRAQAAGNLLVFEPDPHLPPVWGSPEQLAEVVSNLVDNAVKYTRDGVIHVRTRLVASEAWIIVQDTGVGIGEEELGRVFERFFRAESARQLGVPGAGVGLAIVRDIVKSHGGKVKADSTVGEGSVFTVKLPVGEPAA